MNCPPPMPVLKGGKMREIKFRVWDGNNRKFDYPDTIVLSEGGEDK